MFLLIVIQKQKNDHDLAKSWYSYNFTTDVEMDGGGDAQPLIITKKAYGYPR